jgi:hypothetical protein
MSQGTVVEALCQFVLLAQFGEHEAHARLRGLGHPSIRTRCHACSRRQKYQGPAPLHNRRQN